MIKTRPRIRFDGFYVCKNHYVRYGQSETSEYRPSFDVISYKYLKFNPNGVMVSVYSLMPPKKFLKKIGGQLQDITQLINTGNAKKKSSYAPDAALQF